MIVEGKVTEIYGFIGHFGKDFANIKGKHKKNAIDLEKINGAIDKRCFSDPSGSEKHLIKYHWIGL